MSCKIVVESLHKGFGKWSVQQLVLQEKQRIFENPNTLLNWTDNI